MIESSDKNAPELETSFGIAGEDFDTDECTRTIGLEPTKVWIQSRNELKARTDLPNITWTFEVERRLYSTSEGVEETLDLFWPVREKLSEFVAHKGLSVSN